MWQWEPHSTNRTRMGRANPPASGTTRGVHRVQRRVLGRAMLGQHVLVFAHVAPRGPHRDARTATLCSHNAGILVYRQDRHTSDSPSSAFDPRPHRVERYAHAKVLHSCWHGARGSHRVDAAADVAEV